MVLQGCYNVLANIINHYYEKIISRVYSSVEVEEGDQCFEWLAGKPKNHQNHHLICASIFIIFTWLFI